MIKTMKLVAILLAVAVVSIAIAIAALAQHSPAQQRPEVIYGDDDRLDLYQTTNPRLLQLARSTAGLFQDHRVSLSEDGKTARLATASYADDYSLCKDEPFYDQRTGAFCSGSLVAPDILMTAGHCVRSESACQGTKFVFGFSITERGKLPETVPAASVYGCKELLGREEEGRGADWALVRLDRPVKDRKPLDVNRRGDPAVKTPLIVIGHPAGLPTKIAGGAWVRDPSPKGYFVANLDTYGGNSGSAVFNGTNGLIEGILVRGETDYTWRDGCRVSYVCTNDGCRGEDVTKVSALASRIPPAGHWVPSPRPVPAPQAKGYLDRLRGFAEGAALID